MAADIGIGTSERDFAIAVRLSDDAYYWFLYPYFEKANLMLDLYDDAAFAGEQLDRFEEILRRARGDASRQPNSWEVTTGWNATKTPHSEIRKPIERRRLIALIDQLLELTVRARSSGTKLISIGD